MAGRLFEHAKAFRQAADCYEKAGETESAIRVLEAFLAGLGSGATEASAQDIQEARQIELRCVALLESVGDFSKAGIILARLGENDRAAHLLVRARDYDRAVELFFEIRDLGRPADLLPRSTNVEHERGTGADLVERG